MSDSGHNNTSLNLTINLAGWMNRCYSLPSSEKNIAGFFHEFAENLCSLEGIYGAWVFQSKDAPGGYTSIASHALLNEDENLNLVKLIKARFSSVDNLWEVVTVKIRKVLNFSHQGIVQPYDELRIFILPGFNLSGKMYLVLLGGYGLSELLKSLLPGMFQHILRAADLRYEATDSLYRLLVENQNELVVKVDDKGRFLFVSPTYCNLFGLDAKQLIGQSFIPLIHPDDREVTENAMKQLSVFPHTCYVEQRAKTVKGWRWIAWSDKALVDGKGRISAVIGVGRDISEQKKVERELVESELKFQKAFRNSPNLMSISRLKDGLLYDVNDKFASIIGRPREDIIGKSTRELGLFDAMPRTLIESTLMREGKVDDIEFTITTGQNKKLVGLFSSEIIELHGEQCLVSSFSDISELKEAQRELENYRIHLEGLVEQRTARILEINEELDRFAHSVSHDLKAPLRVMQGFVNAILEDHSGNLDDEAMNYLRRIKNASTQMESLINDLLQYSRLSSLELDLKPVSPMKAINKAFEIHADEILAKKARIKVSDNIPLVRSHMPVLVQVFSNLISNSLKFVGKDTAPVIDIRGSVEHDKVTITIRDNGIGIPEDKQERIFDVFERLHGVESFQGSGIGLTIVRKAMDRMGGKILLSSSPGKGSSFTLLLQPVE